MKQSLISLATLCLFALFASANEVSPVIRVDVQMVAMPLAKGLPLLPRLRDAKSTASAFNEIQQMISAGEATLVGCPEVVTKSGQRAVTEDIQEVRYPTAFAAPKVTPAADAPDKTSSSGAPVPSAFETRNIGATLEVEPVLGPDGKTIDLNLVPQHVRLLDFLIVASGRDANGHDWKIEQPQFYSAKTTTSLSLLSGHRVLLAEFRGPEGSDQIMFFLLKAEVMPIDEQQKK